MHLKPLSALYSAWRFGDYIGSMIAVPKLHEREPVVINSREDKLFTHSNNTKSGKLPYSLLFWLLFTSDSSFHWTCHPSWFWFSVWCLKLPCLHLLPCMINLNYISGLLLIKFYFCLYALKGILITCKSTVSKCF